MAEAAPAPRTRYTLAEWRAEAARRFGHPRDWSFVCPVCEHVQSAASIRASGRGDPGQAFSECYGLGTRKDDQLAAKQGKKRGELADCDWKSYGLLRGPIVVVTPEGDEHHVFDFAPHVATDPAPQAGGAPDGGR